MHIIAHQRQEFGKPNASLLGAPVRRARCVVKASVARQCRADRRQDLGVWVKKAANAALSLPPSGLGGLREGDSNGIPPALRGCVSFYSPLSETARDGSGHCGQRGEDFDKAFPPVPCSERGTHPTGHYELRPLWMRYSVPGTWGRGSMRH